MWLDVFFLFFWYVLKSSGRFFEILLISDISVVTSAEELGRRWSHALPPQSKGDLIEFLLIGCFYFLHSFISVFSLSQVTGNFTQSQSKHFCSFDSFDQVMEDKRKKLVIEQANVMTACSSVTIRQIFPKPSSHEGKPRFKSAKSSKPSKPSATFCKIDRRAKKTCRNRFLGSSFCIFESQIAECPSRGWCRTASWSRASSTRAKGGVKRLTYLDVLWNPKMLWNAMSNFVMPWSFSDFFLNSFCILGRAKACHAKQIQYCVLQIPDPWLALFQPLWRPKRDSAKKMKGGNESNSGKFNSLSRVNIVPSAWRLETYSLWKKLCSIYIVVSQMSQHVTSLHSWKAPCRICAMQWWSTSYAADQHIM